MTNVLLIRHATHDMMSTTILGRTPLERTRETAEPLVRTLNLQLEVAEEFNELNMGEWTDRTLAKLDLLPEWHTWNTRRSEITPPSGESMQQVQARVLGKIGKLRNQFRCIAIFTHGDVIRAALTHYLGMHLDLLFRFQIDPGSVSLVQMSQDCAIVRMLNWVPIGTVLS
jgi:probable phosphoglycerate mutase